MPESVGKGLRRACALGAWAAVRASALAMLLCAPAGAAVRFVDASASGAGNGGSWPDAYPELRDALLAAAGNPAITEIWVASGTYRPTAGGDPLATFQLRSGLAIHGGFGGFENSLNERELAANVTILSGDIGVPGDSADNVFHVVTGSGANATALLEGVTITGGNARLNALNRFGGGLLIEGEDSSPVLINCTIRENAAHVSGGGLYNDLGAPTLVNCVFRGNTTAGSGGGAYSARGAARFINCTFLNNTAGDRGGGVFTRSNEGMGCPANASFLNCVLWDNLDAAPFNLEDQIAAPRNFCPPERNLSSAARAALSHGLNEMLVVRHTLMQSWDGLFGGPTNTGADPLFADADGRITGDSPCVDFADFAELPSDVFDLDGDGDTAESVPIDRDGGAREVGAADAGAFEFAYDCNANGVTDDLDIAAGTSRDCDQNATPDECDPATDCNTNGIADALDLADGTSADCDSNCVPDECQLAAGDCNGNGTLDICDLTAGTSLDCNQDGVPDECSPDCNTNAVPDDCDIAAGTSHDCNANAVPDECEDPAGDCNDNRIPDTCELAAGSAQDCDTNGRLDACDIADGSAADCDTNSVPDACELAQRYFLLENAGAGEVSHVRRFDPDNPAAGAPIAAALPAIGNDRGMTVFDGLGQVITADQDQARLLELNVFTGQVVRTIELDRPVIELAYDWTTGRMFASAGDGGLYRVNLATGATTLVSALPGESPTDWVSLTFDDRTRRLIGASQSERRIFFVDPDTGAGADLPELLEVSLGDMATDLVSGALYGLGTDGSIYRISRQTGAVQFVSSLNLSAGTGAGLAILLAADCAESGVLDRCAIADGTSPDCNANQLADACDPDCNANGLPDACDDLGLFDFDGDGDADQHDFAGFPECLTGPDQADPSLAESCLPTCREVFDLDADGDIDLADFAAAQAILGSP